LLPMLEASTKKMRRHLGRLVTRGSQGFNRGGGIRLHRLDEDLPDVGEADETEDVFQVLALLILVSAPEPGPYGSLRRSALCSLYFFAANIASARF
jgi:hypothetical protein